MIFLDPKAQYTGNVPGIMGVLCLSLVWFLNRRGRIQAAILLFMLCIGLSMLYSLLFNGGLNAPFYRALPVYMLCGVFFFRDRFALFFLLSNLALSLVVQVLDHMGYLRQIEPSSGWVLWMFTTIYSLLLFFSVIRESIPLEATPRSGRSRPPLFHQYAGGNPTT